jgi:hypothetical protein
MAPLKSKWPGLREESEGGISIILEQPCDKTNQGRQATAAEPWVFSFGKVRRADNASSTRPKLEDIVKEVSMRGARW